VPAQPTPILINPDGNRVSLEEWLYSGQVELDRSGNNIGLIKGTDSKGYPTRITLQPTSVCSVIVNNDNELTGYRIRGKTYSIDQVWHEKQYTVAGLHVGLSPVAYAAYQIGEYQSVIEFASNWFGNSAVPRVSLKNTEHKIGSKDIALASETWRASMALGEPFITGSDWELKFLNAEQKAADWIEEQRFSIVELARFFGVPAAMIDGTVSGQSVTYTSQITKNLDFLTLHLGPAITRRERALSNLLPRPRFVKFNTDALLRLDPKTRSEMIDTQLRNHSMTVTEARALENRPPLDDAQMAEVMEHFPPKASTAGQVAA
jgi:HK97 family phage portal protein